MNRREILGVILLMAVLVVLFFPDVVFGGRTLSSSATQWGVMGEYPPYGYPEDEEPTHPRVLKGGPNYNNYLADPLAPAAGLEPAAEKVATSLREGEIPLWDRSMGLGRPMILNLGKILRYPVYLNPSPAAWDVFLMARLIVAGLFMYLLARRLGLGVHGSLTSMIVYVFSGYAMLFINMPHVDLLMIIPVALFSLDLLLSSPSAGRLALTSIVLAIALLASTPRTTVVVGLIAAAFGLFRSFGFRGRRPGTSPKRALWPLAAALVAGIALTLWIYLPFIRDVGALGIEPVTAGRLGGHQVGLGHLGSRKLIAQVIPFFEGPPALGFHGKNTRVDHYVGAGAILFAAMGIANRRRMRSVGWFFLALLGIAWLKLYGFPLVNWLGGLPIAEDVNWRKYLPPVATLSIAVLAGIGLDGFMDGSWKKRWGSFVFGGFVAVLVILFWLNRGLLGVIPRFHLAVQLSLIAGVAGSMLVAWLLYRRHVTPSVLAIMLIVIIGGELMFHTLPVKRSVLPGPVRAVFERSQLQVIDRAIRHDPFTEPPFVSFLKRDRSPHRIFGLDRILSPNTAMAFDLEDIRSFTPTMNRRLSRYIREFINPSLRARFTGAYNPVADSEFEPPRVSGNPLFDLLNVKYVLSRTEGRELLSPNQYRLVHNKEGVRVYRNQHALPRAFVVQEVAIAADIEESVQAMKDPAFDPRHEAVVEGRLPASQIGELQGNRLAGTPVQVLEHTDQRVTIRVNGPGSGLLVLADIYHPDWSAYVDGHPADIHPTNVAMRSVFVPRGSTEVVFEFEASLPLRIGGGVSLLILLLLGIGVARELLLRVASRRRTARLQSP